MTEATKTCSACNTIKPVGEYGIHRAHKSGLKPYCKPCAKAYDARWRAGNREHVAEYAWESYYRARARAYGFEPVVRSFTREDLISRYGDACVHCGGPFEELDHYPIPVGLGGVHAIENCRPSCAYDNRANSAAVRIARKAIAG